MDLNNTLKAAATLPRIEMMSIIIKLNAKNKRLEKKNKELKQKLHTATTVSDMVEETLINQIIDLKQLINVRSRHEQNLTSLLIDNGIPLPTEPCPVLDVILENHRRENGE